jgi:alpha-glucosidase (family GH31 glycosyl hydrolase)
MMRSLFVTVVTIALLAACCAIAGAWEFPGVPPDTSRQALTPSWAFEVWMWEDDVNTAAAVWDMVNGCAKYDLPLRAVIIDSPWATAYNNFTWDEVRYPKPQQMIDDLHARGIKVVLWMTDFINLPTAQADARGSTEDLYAIAKEKGYLANGGAPKKWWKGEGGFIDYTNPEAVEWWHGLMDRALLMGTDGWKVDGSAEEFPVSGGFGKAGPITVPQYVDMYYRDTYNHLMRRNPEGVTMCRSCDTGEVGYTGRIAPKDAAPISWFGDQRHTWDDQGIMEAIKDQFCAMQKGYAVMGTDIAGYQSAPGGMPRDLYIRWFQWSTFLPFFLNGGHDEHRPWKYDKGFLDTYRRFAWTHQELAPYFYSQVHEAHDGRLQFMKSAPGEYEYTLGDQFLIAIMYKDETTRGVAFPAGDWIDYFDNSKVYHGPTETEIRVPLDRYPAFIRSGSIIPLNVVNGHAGHGDASSIGALTFDIYPDPKREAVFPLWDETTGKTDIKCTVKGSATEVSIIGAASRNYILRLRMATSPKQVGVAVGVAKRAMLEKLDLKRWSSGLPGWRYDTADKRLWVRVRAAGNVDVTIEP